jgi:hypothetical protein
LIPEPDSSFVLNTDFVSIAPNIIMGDSPKTQPKADGDSEPFYADFSSKDKEKR